MSNPLLRPNDPRFQKPEIRDASGQNRFGESQQPEADSPSESQYAAGASDVERPFVPRYEVQQQPRTALLLLLGGLAWAAAVVGVGSLGGLVSLGWISPLIGAGPGAVALALAYAELKAIQAGAIRADAQSQTRHAFWLALSGLLLCLAIVAAMIYRRMSFLPDVF
jgi:hypothetical protein